jgi:excisionase family DNA binding protein
MEVFMTQNLIGIKEMASKLDVPVSWLYSRTRTNDIPHYKVGKYVRFVESEVWQWLKNMQSGEE